ncbi:MAG: hypothetical protein NZ959_09475 [Armatimonadetes bacterium]|nr:hypothetical protein [Armatimonadota bacterium]MDW8122183.1 hypothetical protein [Armatimonadota bacterium]
MDEEKKEATDDVTPSTSESREEGTEEAPLSEAIAEKAAAPPPLNRWRSAFFVCLVLLVAAVVALLSLSFERFRLSQELEQIQENYRQARGALTAAAKVFLTRADTELGYASVDLEAASRHQLQFHLEEAERWLREAAPLLSPVGQAQIDRLIKALRDLPAQAMDDTRIARQNLAKIRDDLAAVATQETSF